MPANPSEREEEYFARKEFEQIKILEEKNRLEMESIEKAKLKELHYLKCPKCGMQLVEINYKNISVDKCSGCEGIWLDPGELELVANLNKSTLDKWFGVFRK